MKITKSQRSNLVFIAILGVLFFTPLGVKIKEYSARLLSLTPSVESVNGRTIINNYEWKLKGINGDDIDFSKAKDKVVIVFPDHGSRYMSKIYSDKWMQDQGFFDSKNEVHTTIEYIK